jgi:hypothetical protein
VLRDSETADPKLTAFLLLRLLFLVFFETLNEYHLHYFLVQLI